jgi:hypothetical protein
MCRIKRERGGGDDIGLVLGPQASGLKASSLAVCGSTVGGAEPEPPQSISCVWAIVVPTLLGG